jgi:hypothetical protein
VTALLRKLGRWFPIILVVLLSSATAWWHIFSLMAPYDDEGTLICSIQHYLDGHVLYDRFPSAYGPLYFAYQSAPHILTGAAVTNDSVRMISVASWAAAALLVFVLVYRFTGSLALALVAHLAGFWTLAFIAFEPAHPQEICILLLLAIPLAASAGRPAAISWFGVLIAAMALSKFNLAIFVGVALIVVFTLTHLRNSYGRVVAMAVAIGALVLPFVLMEARLTKPWAMRYALMIFFSLLAAILAAARNRIEAISFRHFSLGVVSCVISGGLIASFVMTRGSTVSGMLQSLVLWPRSHFAQSWYLPLAVWPVMVIWAAASVPLAWLASRGRLPQSFIVVLKLMLALLICANIALQHFGAIVGAVTPLLWLVAVPPATQPVRNDLLRPLLAVMGVLQVLYAYPVAGSQSAFVDVLFIVIAALCLWDILPMLALAPAAARVVPAAAAGLVITAYAWTAYQAFNHYESLQPLGLPGAERVHIAPTMVNALRRLQVAARPCSMLVSMPALLSLNLFSGKPAPEGMLSSFANAWFLLLSDSEQTAVIRELAAQPHPCAVYNPAIVKIFTLGGELPSTPLVRYILDYFHTEFEVDGYRFMTPKSP